MNVRIYDHSGGRQYANWEGNEFTGLTFNSEIPGGMISCSFDVPCEYHLPLPWADVFNQVEVYNFRGTLVWSGFIFGFERYWSDTSGIRVDCVGWVAKLSMLTTGSDLSNELGSTWITDHVMVADSELLDWITTGRIETTDYLIPGVIENKPRVTMREAIDKVVEYNQDIYNFYVKNTQFYFVEKTNLVTLETSTEFCSGSLRQDIAEFSNGIYYSYRDMAGLVTTGYELDSDSPYPLTKLMEALGDTNMTAAQALHAAQASLARHIQLGATGGVTVSKVWRAGGGEVPISEVFPGQCIHISGLVTGKMSASEIYTTNNVDSFEIQSVSYDHEAQTIDISPGLLPYSLPKWLSRRKR